MKNSELYNWLKDAEKVSLKQEIIDLMLIMGYTEEVQDYKQGIAILLSVLAYLNDGDD